MSKSTLLLKIQTPTQTVVESDVIKVIAEAENGSFCLLPRHVDFISSLVPGLITYTSVAGENTYVATNDAILVKAGQHVYISSANVVSGSPLQDLQSLVHDQFLQLNDNEINMRNALAHLEADISRRLLDLGQKEYG